jgi:hypothetical protein
MAKTRRVAPPKAAKSTNPKAGKALSTEKKISLNKPVSGERAKAISAATVAAMILSPGSKTLTSIAAKVAATVVAQLATKSQFILSQDETGETPLAQMDVKLQLALTLHRSGVRRNATTSTNEGEIAVVARVSDVAAWEGLTEVRTPTVITPLAGEEGSIVTGRIPIKRIEFIHSLPFVKSLKAARKLKPSLKVTVPDIGANKFSPVIPNQTGGKGIVIGIIDQGCDFAHHNFLDPEGKTRILQLWNQAANPTGVDVKYGRLYKQPELNQALTQADPYAALKYEIEINAHGTHVMDIAAGNGRGSGMPGVAPAADIIFVEPATADIPWLGQKVVGKSFGDSVNLLEAIQYIFGQAGERPCAINISLGTNGGPHDGTTLVEKGIDGMLEGKSSRAVVIAASNSHEDGIHAAGQVPAGGKYDLSWLIHGNGETENEMEVWFGGTARLSVEVIDPSGKSLGIVNPAEAGSVKDSNGVVMLFVGNRLDDPNNHDNVIGIWLKDIKGGKWTVRLKNKGNAPVNFHGWVERNDEGQASFGGMRDNSHTLGSISCGQKSIVVASYDATKTGFPISSFSGEGPTRDGREKPEIAAPGGAVNAAAATTKTELTEKSGTSMASPAVTGCIALLYAAAAEAGQTLTIDKLREILLKQGRLNPPAGVWDGRFGNGRIFIPDMVNALTAAKNPPAKDGPVPKKKN